MQAFGRVLVVLTAALAGAPGAAAPGQDLVLHLPFGEGAAGTALTDGVRLRDVSGRGNDAELEGSAGWAKGRYGSALVVPGGSYLQVPDRGDFSGLTALTIEGWFRTEADSPDQTLVGKWHHPEKRSFSLYVQPSGMVEWAACWSRDGYTVLRDGCPLPPNTWSHIAATWDSAAGLLRLYKNGRLAKEHKAPPGVSLQASDVPLLIGSHNNDPGRMSCFAGAISRLRIWRRALPDGELKAHYARERKGYPAMKPQAPARPAPVDLGSEKQLFLDDTLIGKMEGARLAVNPGLTVWGGSPAEKAHGCWVRGLGVAGNRGIVGETEALGRALSSGPEHGQRPLPWHSHARSSPPLDIQASVG